MKKTTSFSRKRRHCSKVDGAVILIQTLVRALPHTEALEFGNLRIESGPAAERYKEEVRAALERLRVGTASVKDFDDLIHEIAIVGIRGFEFGGGDADKAGLNQIYESACAALDACKKRYQRWGKFDLLASEYLKLQDAIEAWEVIYDASSPEQMNAASAAFVRWAKMNKRVAA